MLARPDDAGRARSPSRPASSSSSRRSAASSVSPGSTPPPGVAHQRRRVTGFSKRTSRTRSLGVDDERAHRLRAATGSSQSCERAEPAQPLGVRDGGVRGRGRRQHEERRRAERAQLRAELGPLAEERRGRPPCRRTRSRAAAARAASRSSRARVEVAAAQVARAGRRPVRGVRHAVAELEQRELLLRVEEPRREAGVVEQPPEVVARIREVRGGGGRDAARVDPAEDAAQARARGRRGRR